MEIQRIHPVVPAVTARAHGEVMVNAFLDHLFMQGDVVFDEDVVQAVINDDILCWLEDTGLHLIYQVANGMVALALLITCILTQSVFDVPAVGILGNVHVAAHAAARPEHIGMAEGHEQ